METGMLNSVQDAGRLGYRHLGVSTSGVMDRLALQCGNMLLNNPAEAACIEIQTFPFSVRFGSQTGFSVTGGHASITLDGKPVLPWFALCARQGDVLRIERPVAGARMYLCIAGGLDVPVVLASRSTQLRGGFGGWQGRPLQQGDELPLCNPYCVDEVGLVPPAQALALRAEDRDDKTVVLRVIPATDYMLFTGSSLKEFGSIGWQITAQSDRVGYRLKGGALRMMEPVELRSYGVVPGIIQVPPSGEPIIQMADANTAGGYPRIATVIEADLWRLAQARIGSFVRLQLCTHAQGLAAAENVQEYLKNARKNIELYRKSFSRRGAGQTGKQA
nr:biotin-dependent carboxyltransferase family protein [Acetobacter okinawensis]